LHFSSFRLRSPTMKLSLRISLTIALVIPSSGLPPTWALLVLPSVASAQVAILLNQIALVLHLTFLPASLDGPNNPPLTAPVILMRSTGTLLDVSATVASPTKHLADPTAPFNTRRILLETALELRPQRTATMLAAFPLEVTRSCNLLATPEVFPLTGMDI